MSALRPTKSRGYAFPDHRPPSGKHASGRLGDRQWLGTSHIIDRAARDRAQRKSWRKELVTGRKAAT